MAASRPAASSPWGATNTEAESQLESTAEEVGLSENEGGAGLLDVASALGYDSSDDGLGNIQSDTGDGGLLGIGLLSGGLL